MELPHEEFLVIGKSINLITKSNNAMLGWIIEQLDGKDLTPDNPLMELFTRLQEQSEKLSEIRNFIYNNQLKSFEEENK